MWLGIVLSTCLWGIAPLFEKIYTKHVSLETIAALFFIINIAIAPIVFLFCRKTILKEVPMLFKDKKNILIYSLLGMACGMTATFSYLWALKTSNDRAYLVVALTCVYPLVTALLLSYLFAESLDKFAWLGIFFIVLGVIFLTAKHAKQ
jgi:uncharacterized membrane protein